MRGRLSGGTFPACIVLGSSFELGFSAADDQFHGVTVESASSSFFSGSGYEFSAERLGRAALVASDDDGRVIDMVHLDIVEPTGLGVWLDGATPPSPLPVDVGVSTHLDVVAGALCGPLGGSLDIDAESSDPSIARAAFGDNGLEIVGVSEGIAIVTLRAGNLEKALTVEVEPAPLEPSPPRRTTPDTDTDTDSDADTDSDSDADTDTGTDTDTDAATDTDSVTGSTGG